MEQNPLGSLAAYSQFISKLLDNALIERSTVAVWSSSPYTGIAEGEVFFSEGLRLRLRQELDFDAALITFYRYQVYRDGARLYWYDDFPRPEDETLASTLPHHKHIPPDIKRHRIPAPELSFTRPNLPVIIREITTLIQNKPERE